MPRRTDEVRAELADELDDDDILRRRVLQATGVGAAALVAGCFGQDGNSDGGSSGGGSGGDGGGSGGDGGGSGGDGGGGEGDQPSGQVHWLMDYADEGWQERWKELVNQYEEEHPEMDIKMEYVGFQGNGGQRLQQLVQAGDPPELFQGTLPQQGLVIGDGRAVPVNEVNDNIREFYDDEIRLIQSAKTGGSAEWLVPHGWQTISTFTYRKDIYDQLSLEVPETWDELLNNAEAIDKDGSIDARGFGLAAQKTGKSASVFDGFFRANGGYYYEEVDGEIEIWFPEDKAIETLEFLKQLAQYSPDPTTISWGPTIKFWLGERIAQSDFVSAWLADVAFKSDLPEIGRNTMIDELPLRNADDDPLDRGLVLIDGTPILKGSNVEGAKDWLTWLYAEDVERAATNNLRNLRLLPSTDALFESDAYQNGEDLKVADGFMLEQQDKVRELAENKSHPDRPASLATNYVTRFPILEEMMNEAIIVERNLSDVVADAKERYETRLAEGKKRVEELPDDYNEYSG